jgi:rhodanese-related sulfurtransferase
MLAVALAGLGAMTAATGLAAEAEDGVKHVDAKGAAELIKDTKNVVVLDIRTPREFAAGHIKDAKNIDYRASDFAEKIGKLDKSKTYVVHCASGGRSTRSLPAFKKLGFKSVVHLDDGFGGWEKAGQPVEKKPE